MTTPKQPNNHKKKNSKKGRGGKVSSSLIRDLQGRMESCKNAETLNDEVITPFIQSLVTVCDARGYVLNVYGENCNLAITPGDHSEPLFQLIEAYLDEANLG